MAFSSSRNLVDSTAKTSGLLAVSLSALQLTGFAGAGLQEIKRSTSTTPQRYGRTERRAHKAD